MNNIQYKIIEKTNEIKSTNETNLTNETNFTNETKLTNETNIDCFIAQQIDYDMNYPLKYIVQIMDYYQFKKTKLNKKQMIERIVEYESLPENFYNVCERKRLFDNYIELKNNKFFSKFIII